MTPAPSLPRASSAPSRATHPSEEKVSRWSGVLPTPPPPRPSLRPSLPQRSLLSQSATAVAQAHPAKMTSSLRLLRSFITRATHALVVHLNSMPSSSRLPRGLLLTLLLIAGACAEEESCSHTQLTTLSREHKSAPWVRFTDESDPLQAWAKQPTEDSSVAVLKVTVLSSAPLRLVTDLFTSQDPEIMSRWNAYTGDVVQLGGHIQVQTYKLPWPFLQREYIVKCESIVLPRDQGHQTHCVPQHEHKEVPFLHDRVRGASETLWSFTSERGKDGRLYTRITFEGIVDPRCARKLTSRSIASNSPTQSHTHEPYFYRGRLPKWIVNEIGKRTSITIVGSLGHLADITWEASAVAEGKSILLAMSFLLLFMGFNALAYTLYLFRARRHTSFGPSIHLEPMTMDLSKPDTPPSTERATCRYPVPRAMATTWPKGWLRGCLPRLAPGPAS